MTIAASERLSREDKAELALAQDMARFYDDPLGWVMYSYPWDTDESIQLVELQEPYASMFNCKYGPDLWACEQLDQLGQEIRRRNFDGKNPVEPIRMADTSGHGIGKSAMTGWLTNFIMSTRPYSQGTITANTSTQLETKTWAQIAKWTKKSITAHWFTVTTGRGSMKMYHRRHQESWFCSAQTCREENSEAFAGQHAANATSFYIFDEASAVPDAIQGTSEGGLTDGEPMMFAFGNPTRNSGWFRECFRKNRHRWICRQIDSRDVQITNKQTIQDWIDDHGIDSDFVKIKVRGVFPSQSALQFFSETDCEQARARHLKKEAYEFAPIVLSCDPAWTGDDEIVIGYRQGLYSKVLKVLPYNDNDIVIANLIARYEDELNADGVHIDGGYGTGIVSAGKTMGRRWRIVWFSSQSPDPGCLNMRAYMYKQVKEWLKEGGAIPDDQMLFDDMVNVETVPRIDGKIQIESKQDLKKRGLPSPNRLDQLGLTFAYPVMKKGESRRSTPEKTEGDYNPYES